MARRRAARTRAARRALFAVALLSTSACGLALGLDGTGSLGFDQDADAAKTVATDGGSGGPEAMPLDAAADARAPDATGDVDASAPSETGPDATADAALDTVVGVDSPSPPTDSETHADVADSRNPADSGTFQTDGNAGRDSSTVTLDVGHGGGFGSYVASSAWLGPATSGQAVSLTYTPKEQDDLFVVPVAYISSAPPTVTASGLSGLDGPTIVCTDGANVALYYGYGASTTFVVTAASTSATLLSVVEFTWGGSIGEPANGCAYGTVSAANTTVPGDSLAGGWDTLGFAVLVTTTSATFAPATGWTQSASSTPTLSASAEWQTGSASGYSPSWTVSSVSAGPYATAAISFNLQ